MTRLTPIRPEALLSKLDYLLRSSAREPRLWPSKIGVCVSGGPDSMALAYLLNNIQHPDAFDTAAFRLTCFVIDHGARVGSYEEACSVQRSLSSLKIESRILQMRWPESTEPSQLPNFESQARRRRYRLVAYNSISEGIRDVFLGHHQDDQIETLMMRLLKIGPKPLLGLRGIAMKSVFPCCDDILETRSTGLLKTQKLENGQEPVRCDEFSELQIHRPLLSFSKQQIMATCEEYNIPFVTDATNFDPTLTTRNAVRKLRTTHVLPQALQNERFLALHTTASNYTASLAVSGQARFEQAVLKYPGIPVGYLDIEVPNADSDWTLQESNATAFALARAVELFTPESLENFPTLLDEHVMDLLFYPDPTSQTHDVQFAKVSFQRLAISSSNAKRTTWRLSRQVMRPAEVRLNSRKFQTMPRHLDQTFQNTKYLFWDGRFWIRLNHRDTDFLSDVEIKPYCMGDAPKFKAQLRQTQQLEMFEEIIKKTAPGKIRYTLPVLMFQNKIIAFPTLDFCVRGYESLTWTIRYPLKRLLPFRTRHISQAAL